MITKHPITTQGWDPTSTVESLEFSDISAALRSPNADQQQQAIAALEEWVQSTTWQDSTAQSPHLLPGLLHVWNQEPQRADWAERDPFAGGWPYIPVDTEVQVPLFQRVLSIMGHVGRPSDVSTLLQHPNESRQSGLWVHTIARIGGHRVLPPVWSRLTQTSSLNETLLLLQCMELLPEPGNLPHLKSCWSSPQPAVRGHALRALRALGQEGVEQLSAVEQLLQDSAVRVREQAALTLGAFGKAAVAPHLVALLQDHEPSVRCCSLQALRRLDVSVLESKLPALCKDPSHNVRHEVLLCLEQIGPKAKELAGQVLPWLTASDTTLAEATARCLGSLGYQPARETLLELVRVPYYDPSLRATSAQALGKIASPTDEETSRILFRMMKFPNPQVQRAAAAVLTTWRHPEIQPILQRWLEHSNPWLQMQAVQSLHELEPIASLSSLLKKLQTASYEQAETIVSTIAGYPYPTPEAQLVQESLRSLLHASRPSLRQQVLQAYQFQGQQTGQTFDYEMITPWLDALQHATEQLLALFYWRDNLPQLKDDILLLCSMIQESLVQGTLDTKGEQFLRIQSQLHHTQESVTFVQDKAGRFAQPALQEIQQTLSDLLHAPNPTHQQWEEAMEDSLFA
ncbi:MAG: HEAT repeat domain-containing protein [Deltaproteobacteria bacterium]|nr:MAG: HEAT repeat domain-containing protein [Deltaproteobacteria bacterium]